MSLSRKIFLAVFVTLIVVGSAFLWGALHYMNQQNEAAFINRYSVFSNVLGDTLTRLDVGTESLMLNAAKVIKEQEVVGRGVLAPATLEKLRHELSMTHIFIVDAKGKFIRSTNEDPGLIPNAFSFCPAYRNLYSKIGGVEVTPVIHPMPEPKPYKFLYIPSSDKKRLINVAVRVDFVAQTLGEALRADSNLVSLSLYSPKGEPLGRFNAKNVEFPEETVLLPESFPKVVGKGDSISIYTKVSSSHPSCCQCDVSKTSKNGEYYYVLESKVSRSELAVMQASTKKIFLILLGSNLLLALLIGRFISRRLVRNIESVAAKKFCPSICVMTNMTKEMLYEPGHGDHQITGKCAGGREGRSGVQTKSS
jgi:hypothetical protein